MAVLDVVPQFKSQIYVDGQPLEEFDDDEDEEQDVGPAGEYRSVRTVTKYIESTSDKEYSVRLDMDLTYKYDSPSLMHRVTIDGKVLACLVLYPPPKKNEYRALTPKFSIVTGHKVQHSVGRGTLRKFKFSKIIIDESRKKEVQADANRLKSAGCIMVELFRGSQPIPAQGLDSSAPSDSITTVHEKALKGEAKSHTTSLSQAIETPVTFVNTHELDGKDYPIAIYKYKYRSREALKELLIIPRTPSISPEPALNLNNLDPDQRRKLNSFLRDLNGNASGARVSVKREREENHDDQNARRKRRSGEKVTIDLTTDSDDDEIVALN